MKGLSDDNKRFIWEWLVPDLQCCKWTLDPTRRAVWWEIATFEDGGRAYFMELPLLNYETLFTKVVPKLEKEGAWLSFHSDHATPWHIGACDEMWEGKQPYLVLLQYIPGRQDNETQPISGS